MRSNAHWNAMMPFVQIDATQEWTSGETSNGLGGCRATDSRGGCYGLTSSPKQTHEDLIWAEMLLEVFLATNEFSLKVSRHRGSGSCITKLWQ